ncbi:MAG: hypothetical protein U5N26_03360 [Candidatus Marinimicrobia bacterium]|nr:hypothetical protein [Candidatus Neomarinimicrobiota bacterium]
MSKFTQWAGVAFFVLILLINVVVARRDAPSSESVVQKQSGKQITTQSSGLPMPANVEVEQPVAEPETEASK